MNAAAVAVAVDTSEVVVAGTIVADAQTVAVAVVKADSTEAKVAEVAMAAETDQPAAAVSIAPATTVRQHVKAGLNVAKVLKVATVAETVQPHAVVVIALHQERVLSSLVKVLEVAMVAQAAHPEAAIARRRVVRAIVLVKRVQSESLIQSEKLAVVLIVATIAFTQPANRARPKPPNVRKLSVVQMPRQHRQ